MEPDTDIMMGDYEEDNLSQEEIEANQRKELEEGDPDKSNKPLSGVKTDVFAKLRGKVYKEEVQVKEEPGLKETPKEEGKPAEKPKETAKAEGAADDKAKGEKAPAQEFDEFVYNKELIKVPVSERTALLQKGYNYDKVKGRAEAAEALLKDVIVSSGYKDAGELVAEIQKRKAEAFREKVEQSGSDPDAMTKLILEHPVVREMREKLSEKEAEGAYKEIEGLPMYKELKDEIHRKSVESPGIDPRVIYYFELGRYMSDKANYDSVLKGERESAIKKTMLDMHDKERRSGLPRSGAAEPAEDDVVLSDFGKGLIKSLHLSAREVTRKVSALRKAKER